MIAPAQACNDVACRVRRLLADRGAAVPAKDSERSGDPASRTAVFFGHIVQTAAKEILVARIH